MVLIAKNLGQIVALRRPQGKGVVARLGLDFESNQPIKINIAFQSKLQAHAH